MFPYSCDALLYHLPIATIGLIVLNVVLFVGHSTTPGGVAPDAGWLLLYGEGLHPAQWIMSRFAHASVEHLVGNMFFLWTFGLITEGKLGWWRFLSCYLVIAVGQAAIEQAALGFVATDSVGSLGASAAIFGLMAMACVWAPMNLISIATIFYFRLFIFEVSVGIFAAFYIGLDLTWCLLLGSGAGSSILHLMGGAMGAVLGVV
ncbi:MAG: rhomboid family intramembrane serine protease, partial [Planctomycetales bacterium]|nr:rhomboid family intramembrane serine protease [Planctomycetales bacterium]